MNGGKNVDNEKEQHSMVAGAIFDFAGYLTTREGVMPVGSSSNVAPMVEYIEEWAKLRELDTENADVKNWQTTLRTG